MSALPPRRAPATASDASLAPTFRLVMLVVTALAVSSIAGCGGGGDVQIDAPASVPTAGDGAPAPTPPGAAGSPGAPTTPLAGVETGDPLEARAGSPFGDDDVVLVLAAAGIAATRHDRAVACSAGYETAGYAYTAAVGGEELPFDLWVYPTPRLLAEAGWVVEESGRASGCGSFGSADYPGYAAGNVALTTSAPLDAARERLVAAFLSLRSDASVPPPTLNVTSPFGTDELLTALADAGLAYAPSGDSFACRGANVAGLRYTSPSAPELVLWVYGDPDELREDWVVERGQRPRYHDDSEGACLDGGWVYWNENLLLVLDGPDWAAAEAERSTVVDAFLSLARAASDP